MESEVKNMKNIKIALATTKQNKQKTNIDESYPKQDKFSRIKRFNRYLVNMIATIQTSQNS